EVEPADTAGSRYGGDSEPRQQSDGCRGDAAIAGEGCGSPARAGQTVVAGVWRARRRVKIAEAEADSQPLSISCGRKLRFQSWLISIARRSETSTGCCC